jgi:glyceraldehyde-3-phosphate dehydrogenase (NAD(P))
MDKIKVGVNGYGVIGKRAADAIRLQKDMKLVGIAKMRADWSARLAIEKGIKLFAARPEAKEEFHAAGLRVEGDVSDLLHEVDVIVDCSPKKRGIDNKVLYDKHHKNAIFEGGEKADIAQISFNASCNFNKAVGQKRIRVISCNTTGICRSINVVKDICGVKIAHADIIRRSVDPHDCKTGPINAIIPTPTTIPSHHGQDIKTVLPEVNVITSMFTVPTTLMHVHSIMVETKSKVEIQDVLDGFANERRLRYVTAKDGIISTSQIMEMTRDKGNVRGDLYDTCIWKESVSAIDANHLCYLQTIHQEAIVIPENIDAIRAMFNLCDKETSMEKTDRSLGVQM